jgi:predicted  nucleic acid-binding Zn-ribbon protein
LSKGKQLYELQEVDLEIDAKRETLTQVMGRLGESEVLDEAHLSLARDEEKLVELQRIQREVEREVEDLQAKAAVATDKLYGGTVKNPKELSSLQEQLSNFQRKIGEGDDKTLDIMSKVEAAQKDVSVKRSEVAKIEEGWQAEQASLSQEQTELSAALSTLEQKRKELASKLDTVSLELYEDIRQKRQGRAVAKLERGMCQGCRIALPMSELQRARMGQELVQCGSCERVLYVS